MTSQHEVYVIYYYVTPQQYNCTVCGALLSWNYNQEYNSNRYVLRLYVILPSLSSVTKNCGSIGVRDRQYAYTRNIEALSLKHFCSGKPINITYSGSVCVALVILHPLCMRRIILSSVACLVLPYFYTLIKGYYFRKTLLNKTFVLWFSLRLFFFKKSPITRRIKRDIVTNIRMSSCTVPVNPSAWGHLNPSSYCDVGRLFYGVFKLWSKLQRKKLRNNF